MSGIRILSRMSSSIRVARGSNSESCINVIRVSCAMCGVMVIRVITVISVLAPPPPLGVTARFGFRPMRRLEASSRSGSLLV